MALPEIPLTLVVVGGGPCQVRQGDHGGQLAFNLWDATGGTYLLPVGSTVVLVGVERPDAPTRERRLARTMGGAMTVDSSDLSLVRYVVAAADAAHAGVFDCVVVATLPTGEVLSWPSESEPPGGLIVEVTTPSGV